MPKQSTRRRSSSRDRSRRDDDDDDGDVPTPRIPVPNDANKKRRRKLAKTMAKARVARESWPKELKERREFKVPIDRIRYADDRDTADRIAQSAINDLDREKAGKVLVGFDTEGSIFVLQLFFRFGDREYARIFQLNRIIVDGEAPKNLIRLLTHPKVVFTGKNVNGEAIEVLRMCGAGEEFVKKIKIIENQRCFETIEMAAKGDEYARDYLSYGRYHPSFAPEESVCRGGKAASGGSWP